MFEQCGRTDDNNDGRRIMGILYSSTSEPEGSGELKRRLTLMYQPDAALDI